LTSRTGVDDFTNFVFLRLWLEGGEDPRGSGCHPWLWVSTWRDLHDQIERVVVPGTLLAYFVGEVGKLIGSRKVDREQPVLSEGASYRRPVGPVGGNPDRDSRVLDWRWLESFIPVSGEPFESTIQETGACARIHFVAKGFEVFDIP
jgi:hypothetical protein